MNGEKAEQEDVHIDAKLVMDDVTWKTYNQIEQLAPFGIGNPKPMFLFENSMVVGVKQFGKSKEHLELIFKNSNQKPIKAIAFFTEPEDFTKAPKINIPINLVATFEKSMFGYNPELRLRIVDSI
jgi:single-stranded DNA-specific DHH superfamily exonuclease